MVSLPPSFFDDDAVDALGQRDQGSAAKTPVATRREVFLLFPAVDYLLVVNDVPPRPERALGLLQWGCFSDLGLGDLLGIAGLLACLDLAKHILSSEGHGFNLPFSHRPA
jgi:hypothetical protein